jgi:hypothetical protein
VHFYLVNKPLIGISFPEVKPSMKNVINLEVNEILINIEVIIFMTYHVSNLISWEGKNFPGGLPPPGSDSPHSL